MKAERRELIRFTEACRGLDDPAKLRLILVAAGVKPAAYVPLKVTPENMDDKAHLERHLRKAGFVFRVSRPKSFEEIVRIRRNEIMWGIQGTWQGYDIFKNAGTKKVFDRYVGLVKRQCHNDADKMAGRLYGYPSCCIRQFIKEHDPAYLSRYYTSYSFYKKLHRLDRAFPFISHSPCRITCPRTKELNTRYRDAVRDNAPRFWKQYTSTRVKKTNLLVEGESAVYKERMAPKTPVWTKVSGHEYALLTLSRVGGHYVLVSYLTRTTYQRGTVLAGTIRLKYDYADVTVHKVKSVRRNIRHIRNMPALRNI